MKKDLLNRTGNSTGEKKSVISYMRKKDRHPCITESSSCTPKTKYWKSTLVQYKKQ